MPEHTSFFSYLIAQFPALGHNMHAFGKSLQGQPVTAHGAEPLVASAFLMLLVIVLAFSVRTQVSNYDKAVLPEAKLSLRTFFEIYIGYWYQSMKDMMGPRRAKKYFPIVGSLACFLLFANGIGLVPGFMPPTSNWNVTLGCALVVFVVFNYYGFKENGFGYVMHLFGPDRGIFASWPSPSTSSSSSSRSSRRRSFRPPDAERSLDPPQHGRRPSAGHAHARHGSAVSAHPPSRSGDAGGGRSGHGLLPADFGSTSPSPQSTKTSISTCSRSCRRCRRHGPKNTSAPAKFAECFTKP